jgi:hypothetical protein
MNIAEFLSAVDRDKSALNTRNAPAGVSTCAHCHIPLQESVTGNRPYGEDALCSDCYFDDFSKELDSHPIAALRVARGA